ncbi:MAG: beta-ketoacyl synthase N-terminal-like domain-containing protein [Desulfobacteraceae bacterium]|jgi:3-oxoacyl-[acyl-carrier-protein] synthase II
MNPCTIITGIGIVSPGYNLRRLLKEGNNVAGVNNRIDTGRLIPDLAKAAKCSRSILRQLDITQQMVLHACISAIGDARLNLNKVDRKRIAIILGTEYGDLTIYEHFFDTLQPTSFRSSLPSTPGLAASIALRIYGHSMTLLGKYSSGMEAIIQGIEILEQGDADIVLAGGFERITETIYKRYELLDLLSKNNISCPYARGRDGIVLTEGAGIVILEKKENAQKRGACFHAEIAGYGIRMGEKRDFILKAMEDAVGQLTAEKIDCIMASANSSPVLDVEEASAIRKLSPEVPVTAIKSIVGEGLGFGGLTNVIGGIYCLQDQCIPATINCSELDTSCKINLIRKYVEKKLHYVLVNSVGTNAVSLLLKDSD